MSPKFQNQKVLVVFAAILLLSFPARADSATGQTPVARAEAALGLAWNDYQADTNSAEAACVFARASYDLANLATNDIQRAQVARRGIAVCRQLLAKNPGSAPGHYFLGINLGKLAQAEAPSLAAYRLVHEVESEFKTAAELDVKFDHAGPARTLGLLYFQAPGWPLSIGSKTKANEWLTRATELAPDYPPNELNLAEAQLKWRQREKLEITLNKMDVIWPVAQTNYSGETWQEYWPGWNARRTALKADYQRLYGEKQ
jgi:hypothetical protein